MKILVYNHRADETEYFQKFKEKYNVDLMLTDKTPTIETADFAKGFDCISIITTPINAALIKKFNDVGVKFISTRTIGYDHIDIKKAKELRIGVGNVTYSPRSVADYTVMMILMATRKVKAIMQNSYVQDYSLEGIQGKELHNLTVGVIGTGKIGRTVIKNLKGFECNIIAYDINENEEVKAHAKYVKLEELLMSSDVITVHVPGAEDNYHLINKNSISKMKDGVFIINTARGSIINTYDFIDAVEKGKIGGAALDVIENETNLYYKNLKGEVLGNRELAVLKSYPNVIITPHTAFYTDQAVSDMVENSILSCIAFYEGKENPWKVL
ncbi:D-lactate dehydrogenase [Clostridium acetobutylicum]|uniref:Lactate dehydrogenase n=1 Tax=Clostridium acetobutylicum (strain ATCC 824 / DSM 792 / JCM 1419 / IAM 19013 / LMG 5710 / NBRC 13948 / NRRL B-527 / VKM B-1787 / 2291 / W) TaxID=272562 RepID=Q97IU7_CLOAB|nr:MULTISPECIES: D-isomer specific 2-hydroxyacid dehydrogenase family protein [Clostridium]AAK79510.1 Lactate dehydrogenase [Clostridium acetobutylicum ATCC 824]ADZ20595.1 Lactate dehydrogenase [Clostridium acetobutylicum EA 2018]AEI34471.1 lactate dehydrogenase [Clostridium acetobutylicum DSM 1731]AWV81245.1 lactate dehydrogenase [Clostridium acetobutylicum]MBC2392878.1 lactate dehydrogenase [Clostridium acetobutylicum]